MTVNSFANETAELIVWQDTHDMSLIDFQSAPYPDNVHNWLTGKFGPFSGAALIVEMGEIEKVRLKMKTSVNTWRDRQIAAGCNTPSGMVDTDEKSLRNIMAIYQTASLSLLTNTPFKVTWRLQNNSEVILDAQAMVAIGNAVLSRVSGCYNRSWEIKTKIDDAKNLEELNTIDVFSGWSI